MSSSSLSVKPRFNRKATNLDAPAIKIEFLATDMRIPFVVRPVRENVDLITWASNNKEMMEKLLLDHRALLFRGFEIKSPSHFEWFAKITSNGPLLEYKDRSTPRYEVGQKVYVSTIYPSDQRIHLHNEGTYWMKWPLKIYFCCMKPSESGGETPIADIRNVYNRIDPEIREEFSRRQVMYVRNYNPGVGLTWEDAFQTTERAAVEEYGAQNSIQIEWQSDGRLLTRQVRPAIRTHPNTGELSWFNHAAFFHVSSLEPPVREALLSSFQEEGLPYNTYYGDGGRIDSEVISAIRSAYSTEEVKFLWEKHDVLMLDNMSVAHAREPYTGERNVIVAMTEAQSGERT